MKCCSTGNMSAMNGKCADMPCCKDKNCDKKKDGAAMKCCAENKQVMQAGIGKEMSCCNDKACCKS